MLIFLFCGVNTTFLLLTLIFLESLFQIQIDSTEHRPVQASLHWANEARKREAEAGRRHLTSRCDEHKLLQNTIEQASVRVGLFFLFHQLNLLEHFYTLILQRLQVLQVIL